MVAALTFKVGAPIPNLKSPGSAIGLKITYRMPRFEHGYYDTQKQRKLSNGRFTISVQISSSPVLLKTNCVEFHTIYQK